jgi:hypothetical protein
MEKEKRVLGVGTGKWEYGMRSDVRERGAAKGKNNLKNKEGKKKGEEKVGNRYLRMGCGEKDEAGMLVKKQALWKWGGEVRVGPKIKKGGKKQEKERKQKNGPTGYFHAERLQNAI